MNKEEWNYLTNGEKAWKLGLVMKYMNNEDAYYESGWLYFWPDGESYEQCLEDFDKEESYKELENAFRRIYGDEEYRSDGLYAFKIMPREVLDIAHFWDSRLGLKPIEVVK